MPLPSPSPAGPAGPVAPLAAPLLHESVPVLCRGADGAPRAEEGGASIIAAVAAEAAAAAVARARSGPAAAAPSYASATTPSGAPAAAAGAGAGEGAGASSLLGLYSLLPIDEVLDVRRLRRAEARAAPAAAVRGTGSMVMPLNHDNDPGPVIPPAVRSTTSWRWMTTPAWLCRIDSVMPAPDNMIQVFTIL